jgi:hypothetical protein
MPLIATDAARLLGAIADALNNAERHGIAVDLEHGAAMTRYGYVLPSGDGRLGSRWAVRKRLWPAEPPAGSENED